MMLQFDIGAVQATASERLNQASLVELLQALMSEVQQLRASCIEFEQRLGDLRGADPTATKALVLARLRRAVEQQGLSQAELARRCSMSRSVLGRIMRGQRELRDGELERLAAALDLEIAQLRGA